MEIINISLDEEMPKLYQSIACIGYFDGMHLGHMKLIETTVDKAKAASLKAAMVTFEPDPWVVLKNLDVVSQIASMKQRQQYAKEYGIDYFIIIKFTKELSQLTPNVFIDKVLLPLNFKGIVCGFDFTFGKMGTGNTQYLIDCNLFDVYVVDQVSYLNQKISSSRIEDCILNGEMLEAAKMLNRAYRMDGVVVKGRQMGRTINYPTANLQTDILYVNPKEGVYAGVAIVDNKRYAAMINLGHNSAFNYREFLSLEVHILDFDQDIYDKEISILWGPFVRGEINFNSIDDLKIQLQKDEVTIRKWFDNAKNDPLFMI